LGYFFSLAVLWEKYNNIEAVEEILTDDGFQNPIPTKQWTLQQNCWCGAKKPPTEDSSLYSKFEDTLHFRGMLSTTQPCY
jgi:hypothetical protein